MIFFESLMKKNSLIDLNKHWSALFINIVLRKNRLERLE